MQVFHESSRKFLASYLSAVARGLSRVGLTPNALTLIGLGIAGLAAYLTAIGQLAAGGAVVLFAGAFDMLDGAVARLTGKASNFGALFDSVIDRASEAVVLLGVLLFYLDTGNNWGAALAYVTFGGSVMVSYVRARAEGLGIECKVGIMTRPERVILTGAGLIAAQFWAPAITIVLGVIAVLTIFTTIQRIMVVEQQQASKREG